MKRIKQLIKNLVWLSRNDLAIDKRKWIEAKDVRVTGNINGDKLILSSSRKRSVPKMPDPLLPMKIKDQVPERVTVVSEIGIRLS